MKSIIIEGEIVTEIEPSKFLIKLKKHSQVPKLFSKVTVKGEKTLKGKVVDVLGPVSQPYVLVQSSNS